MRLVHTLKLNSLIARNVFLSGMSWTRFLFSYSCALTITLSRNPFLLECIKKENLCSIFCFKYFNLRILNAGVECPITSFTKHIIDQCDDFVLRHNLDNCYPPSIAHSHFLLDDFVLQDDDDGDDVDDDDDHNLWLTNDARSQVKQSYLKLFLWLHVKLGYVLS